MKTLACLRVTAFKEVGLAAAVMLVLAMSLINACMAQESADVHITPNEHTHADTGGTRNGRPDYMSDMRTSLLRVNVDLVLVPVTVTDSLNRPVTGLSKGNFAVYEDEKPQHIRYFSAEDSPISVGILLDVSGTMSNKVDAAREALADFFKASHPDDDYFVITFADQPKLLADSTKSIGEIQDSLATVKPFGYTALLDAIEMALDKLQSARYQRRALLIISDGGDNSSRHKLSEVKASVEESDVEVYAIGLFDDGLPIFKAFDEKLGKRILSQVTEAGGGRTVTVENLARLSQAAASISTEMRTQYLLGYRPANSVRNGKWRRIKVRVATAVSGDASVRLHPAYKKGYMAPAR